MLIDKYIQQWARQILKESDEDKDYWERINQAVGQEIITGTVFDFCVIVVGLTLKEPGFKYSRNMFGVEFNGMSMVTKNQDAQYTPTEQCRNIFGYFDMSKATHNEAVRKAHELWSVLDKDGLFIKLLDSWKGLSKEMVTIKNVKDSVKDYEVIINPGVFELSAELSFGKVKNGTFKLIWDNKKPNKIAQFEFGDKWIF